MLPPQRQRTIGVISAVLTAVALVAYLAVDPTTGARVRTLLGLEKAAGGDTPGASYAFLQTDPVTGTPASWDACRPVEYVVNPAGAPPDGADVLAEAVTRVEEASGFELSEVGQSDDRDFDDRSATGLSPDPVLVGWAEEGEVPDLAGDVAGVGGAVAVDEGRRWRYRSGSMVLDTATFDRLGGDDRHDVEVAIVMHELGHVLGLGHVDDAGELMNDEGIDPRPRFGPGDLAGLARLADLGGAPCG